MHQDPSSSNLEIHSIFRDLLDMSGPGGGSFSGPQPESDHRETTPLWALIIGVNMYRDDSVTNLEGAVSDAEQIRNFLMNTLRVPERQIRMLLDVGARRTNILSTFRDHLVMNSEVHHGDPLLFYFAGHGSRYSRQLDNGTKVENYWETICPSDRGVWNVSDITDRELGYMFAMLQSQKGNNITVIMDCCHVGGGERAYLRVRCAPPIQDSKIVSAMHKTTLHSSMRKLKLRGPDLTTHVLLAACRQGEVAYESTETSSGLFTSALLRELNEDRPSQLTYEGLVTGVLSRFPGWPGKLIQHAQCEGKNMGRTIFDGRAPGWSRRLVPIAFVPEGRLRVEAGAIHGVALGTKFSVWQNGHATADPPCGKLVVTEVFSVYSFVTVESGFAPQDGWYAGVSWWANTSDPYNPVHVMLKDETAQDECQRILAALLQPRSSGQSRDGIEVAVVLETAAVPLISVSNRVMTVDRSDLYTGAVVVDFPCPSPKEGLKLLNRVLRFELHLMRTNPARPLVLLDTLEFSLVRGDARTTNLFNERHHAFLPDSDACYHFIVTNRGDSSLWVSLYFFDPATYTVTELYSPPSNTVEPTLKPNNNLIIGELNSEVVPFFFRMTKGLKEDTGFAKFFISETYADLAILADRDRSIYAKPRRIRAGTALSKDGLWDSIVTTITIRQSHRGIEPCTTSKADWDESKADWDESKADWDESSALL